MGDIRQASRIETAPRNERGWTFAVDTDRRGRFYFASADEALRFARFDVYLAPGHVNEALAKLRDGIALRYRYGFAEMRIAVLDQYGRQAAGPCISCGCTTSRHDSFLGQSIFRCDSAECVPF